MKILFIYKIRNSNHYGKSVGLNNSANFVSNGLRKWLGVNAIPVGAIDGNSIDKILTEYKPTIAIVEAIWISPSKLREIAALHPKVIIDIRLHSKAGFLASEGNILDWLNQYKNISWEFSNVRLSCNHKEFTKDISEAIDYKFDYLPNVYCPLHDPYPKPHKHHHDSNVIDIGCFGAIREMKNQLEQAIASILLSAKLGKRLRFHINTDRNEGYGGNAVYKNIVSLFAHQNNGNELVQWPWMSHNEFLQLMSKMDICSCVSYDETFCIVLADAVYSKIPFVCSEDISWANPKYFVKTNDTREIVNALDKAYYEREKDLDTNLAYLNKYNHESLRVWDKFLKEICG